MKTILWLIGGWIKSVFTRRKGIRLLPLLACASLCAQVAVTGKFTIAWDPNPESDLAGYRLYVAPSLSTNFVRVAELTNTTATITITNRSRVFVTAFNTSQLESLPSNVLQLNPTQPVAPTKLILQTLVLTYTNR